MEPSNSETRGSRIKEHDALGVPDATVRRPDALDKPITVSEEGEWLGMATPDPAFTLKEVES
jgi:hypothetical protein